MKPNIGQGDHGKTHLLGGKNESDKVPKDSGQVEAYGVLDELNSLVGYIRAHALSPEIDEALGRVQRDLFCAEAHISAAGTKYENNPALPDFGEEHVLFLESKIQEWEEKLPQLKNFILPGGTKEASLCDMARTLSRRAERRIVSWRKGTETNEASGNVQKYVNRLSDFFFALERLLNMRAGKEPTLWSGREK